MNAASSRETSLRRHFLRLAGWFDAATPDDAHVLYTSAFALYGARHLGVALDPDVAEALPATTSWWRAPAAPVPVSIRERGDRNPRGRVVRVADHGAQKERLVDERRREAAQREPGDRRAGRRRRPARRGAAVGRRAAACCSSCWPGHGPLRAGPGRRLRGPRRRPVLAVGRALRFAGTSAQPGRRPHRRRLPPRRHCRGAAASALPPVTAPRRWRDEQPPAPTRDDAERQDALRLLLRHPLITADGPHAEGFRLVRRHRDELARDVRQLLGYRLVVEAGFARLYKAGLGARPGAAAAPDLRRAVLSPGLRLPGAVLRGAAHRPPAGAAVVARRAGAPRRRRGRHRAGRRRLDADRRAFVAALRQLVALGVLVEDDGTVAAFADDAEAEALAVRPARPRAPPARRAAARGRAAPTSSCASPPNPASAPAPATGSAGCWSRSRRWSPTTSTTSRGRGCASPSGARRRIFAELFGLELEIRAEGVAAIDPRDELTDVPFPRGGTLGHAALLALAELAADCGPSRPRPADSGRTGAGARRAARRRSSPSCSSATAATLAARTTSTIPSGCSADVEDLLVADAACCAGVTTAGCELSAVASRYAPDVVEAARRPRRSNPRRPRHDHVRCLLAPPSEPPVRAAADRTPPARRALGAAPRRHPQRLAVRPRRAALRRRPAAAARQERRRQVQGAGDAAAVPARRRHPPPRRHRPRPHHRQLADDRRPAAGNHVGYVWLELRCREATAASTFLTLGAGLKASTATRRADAWFFITERRVGVDLELDRRGRVPVDRPAEGGDRRGGRHRVGRRAPPPGRPPRVRPVRRGPLRATCCTSSTACATQHRQPRRGRRAGQRAQRGPPADRRDACSPTRPAASTTSTPSASRSTASQRAPPHALGQFLGTYRGYTRTVLRRRAAAVEHDGEAGRAARPSARHAAAGRSPTQAEQAVEQPPPTLERPPRRASRRRGRAPRARAQRGLPRPPGSRRPPGAGRRRSTSRAAPAERPPTAPRRPAGAATPTLAAAARRPAAVARRRRGDAAVAVAAVWRPTPGSTAALLGPPPAAGADGDLDPAASAPPTRGRARAHARRGRQHRGGRGPGARRAGRAGERRRRRRRGPGRGVRGRASSTSARGGGRAARRSRRRRAAWADASPRGPATGLARPVGVDWDAGADRLADRDGEPTGSPTVAPSVADAARPALRPARRLRRPPAGRALAPPRQRGRDRGAARRAGGRRPRRGPSPAATATPSAIRPPARRSTSWSTSPRRRRADGGRRRGGAGGVRPARRLGLAPTAWSCTPRRDDTIAARRPPAARPARRRSPMCSCPAAVEGGPVGQRPSPPCCAAIGCGEQRAPPWVSDGGRWSLGVLRGAWSQGRGRVPRCRRRARPRASGGSPSCAPSSTRRARSPKPRARADGRGAAP